MEHVIVHPEWSDAVRVAGWRSAAEVLAAFGLSPRPDATRVEVVEAALPVPGHEQTRVYVKRYGYRRPTWRFFARRSKALREYENYLRFERIGLSAAAPVLCAEQRDGLGRLVQAVIITVAVAGAQPLLAFVERACPNAADPAHGAARRAVSRQLAAMLRTAHGAGFRHHDLHWRNVLVAERDGVPTVFWIDCPRGQMAPRLLPDRPFVLKDLATLDRVGHRACTLRERVRFLRSYLGDSARPGAAAALAREVGHFSASRRQWRRTRAKAQRA